MWQSGNIQGHHPFLLQSALDRFWHGITSTLMRAFAYAVYACGNMILFASPSLVRALCPNDNEGNEVFAWVSESPYTKSVQSPVAGQRFGCGIAARDFPFLVRYLLTRGTTSENQGMKRISYYLITGQRSQDMETWAERFLAHSAHAISICVYCAWQKAHNAESHNASALKLIHTVIPSAAAANVIKNS